MLNSASGPSPSAPPLLKPSGDEATTSVALTTTETRSSPMQVKQRASPIGVIRRQRLTADQHRMLEAEFQKDANWTIRKTRELSTKLALDRTKIYKWNYDRKRKQEQAAE